MVRTIGTVRWGVSRWGALVCLGIGLFAPGSSSAGFLYALSDHFSGNVLHGYRVDEGSGSLTPIPGFPVPTGGFGDNFAASERIAVDAVHGRLFVAEAGLPPRLSAYQVDRRTGAVAPLPFHPIAGLSSFDCLAMPASPSFVIGADGRAVRSFVLSASAATAAPGAPFVTHEDVNAFSCTAARDGRYVFVGGNIGPQLTAFSVDPDTRALTRLGESPVETGGMNPVAYATDHEGRLFVAHSFSPTVGVFTTSSGLPTPVAGSPFRVLGSGGIHGVLHPAGYYMVATRFADSVAVFRIDGHGDATTVTAVPGTPFRTGGMTTNVLALDVGGAHLFAANSDSRSLSSFAVDAASGALTLLSVQPNDTLGAVGDISGLGYVSPCGDGTVDASEQCDDGNDVDGDCCSATCRLEAAGAACDDGDACSEEDECDGLGACRGGTAVTCDDDEACTVDTCNPEVGCVHDRTPRASCRGAARSTLSLRESSGDLAVAWRFERGESTPVAELGDPTVATRYALCLYSSGSFPVDGAARFEPGPSWSPAGKTGFRHRTRSGGRTTRVRIQGGEGVSSKIAVDLGGARAAGWIVDPLPVPSDGSPITVQLVNTANDRCWGARFGATDIRRNDARRFRARNATTGAN